MMVGFSIKHAILDPLEAFLPYGHHNFIVKSQNSAQCPVV